MPEKKVHFFITNDDGYDAKGLKELIEVARELGKVTAIAPAEGHSGMSHAITVKHPLRIELLEREEDFELYKCWGTPVDCVKLAFNRFLPEKPDMVLSGVNHGSNSSTSIMYSGTMAAAMEGALYEIPSIGFSLLDWRTDADFSISKPYIQQLILKIIKHKYLDGICLNVNIPAVTKDEIQGIKICRQTKGHWIEEFEQRTDPHGREYYWLTGEFHNREPEAEDTDEWALINNYISVVPVHVDMTAYRVKEELDKIDFNADITQD